MNVRSFIVRHTGLMADIVRNYSIYLGLYVSSLEYISKGIVCNILFQMIRIHNSLLADTHW